MSDAKRYEIRTVWDFLKVPEPRREDCLKEFHVCLAMAEAHQAIFASLAKELDTRPLFKLGDVFTWIDDDKRTASVSLELNTPASPSPSPEGTA